MNNMQKIDSNFKFYHFGPIIAHQKLKNDFLNQLKIKGNKAIIDYRKDLAGHLDNEKAFSKDDKEWFINETKEIFFEYVQVLIQNSFSSNKANHIKSMNLDNLWVNHMKHGEFNPIHIHGGDISFVIYTSVPKEIENENNSFKGTGSGPGCISFYYGEHSESFKSTYDFFPQEGDIFIFPAFLRHSVPPFKSKVTRVSISGNITLT